MSKKLLLLGVTAAILGGLLVSPAAAQYNPEHLYQHLQSVYERNDGDISGYLIDELTQFGLIFPDDARAADASWLLAKIYLDKNKRHEALAAAYKTLYLYPRSLHEGECRDIIQNVLAKEVSYAPKKGLLESAVYGTALDAVTLERWHAYLNLLKDLDQPKLYDWSLAEVRTFVTRFPEDTLIYPFLEWTGDLYHRLGRIWEAIYSYRKLEEIFPDNPQLPYALHQQALLLSERAAKHEDAVSRLTRILAHYPESDLAPTAAYTIGKIKEKELKDYNGAIEAYRKLVVGWPKDERAVEVLIAIADIQDRRLKQYDLALATYDNIIKEYASDPRGARALELAGDLYAENLKDYLNAASSYARVSKLYTADEKAPDLLIKAGDLCADRLKDYRKAIDYYKMVANLYPASKKVKDANKRIDKALKKITDSL